MPFQIYSRIIVSLGFVVLAVFLALQMGAHLVYPILTMSLILVGLIAAFFLLKFSRIHWLIRSAEWELMEQVSRVETGTDSRTRKAEEKIDYFSRLAEQTTNVYARPAQAGGHLVVGNLPKAPFRNENLRLLDSQHEEMEKVSKRKARVRLNAALLRELLYGTTESYTSRINKLSASDRANIMATIETLSKVNPSLVWATAKTFGHPSKLICWNPKDLTGRKALDYLCRV